MAFLTEAVVPEVQAVPRRRQYPRTTLRSLAYVKIDQGNGGIVRDLTESGIAIQAVAPLRAGQEVLLRFDLLSPRVRVEAHGTVCWAESGGQAGVQFSGLPPRTRNALRDWMLMQMLSAAAVSGRDSIFAGVDTHLALSTAIRAPILLPPAEGEAPTISWGIFSFTQRAFSIFVDILVLSCAALLFIISALAVMGGFPAWPLSAALIVTSTTIFISVYRLLFSDLLCGATPGRRLAILASHPSLDDSPPRFR
ncbi:MAG TPA: PilZ domain-containing protein [Terriglobales bacterium]